MQDVAGERSRVGRGALLLAVLLLGAAGLAVSLAWSGLSPPVVAVTGDEADGPARRIVDPAEGEAAVPARNVATPKPPANEREGVEESAAEVVVAFPLPPPSNDWLLEVRAVDHRGAPVVDAEVQVVGGTRQSLGSTLSDVLDMGRAGKEPDRYRTGQGGRCQVRCVEPCLVVEAEQVDVGSSGWLLVERPDESGMPSAAVELQLRRPASVRGVVFDAAGVPLVDVSVVAEGVQTRRAGLRVSAVHVRTAADGTFELQGLEGIGYQLHAVADGTPSLPGFAVAGVDEVPFVELRMPGAMTITGRLFDPEHRLLTSRARVCAWSAEAQRAPFVPSSIQQGPVGPDGTFRIMLPAFGTWTVVAMGRGFASSAVRRVAITREQPHAVVDLQLQQFATLAGRVVDVDGAPLADVRVAVAAEDDREVLEAGVPAPNVIRVGGGSVATDEGGRFEVPVQPDCRWSVSASRGADSCVERDVAAGREDVVLVLGAQPVRLRGRVRRQDGREVGAYTIETAIARGPMRLRSEVDADIDGAAFSFALDTRGARFDVIVVPADDALAPCRRGPFVVGDRDLDATFTLAPWGRVVVQVVDRAGRPKADVAVVLAAAEQKVTTDAAGMVVLERCMPGASSLRVLRADRELCRREISIGSGRNATIVVQLP